jgi:predicted dehydrogenase
VASDTNDARQLNVGIAGYGMVGKLRHKYADAHPNLRVTAVADQTIGSTAEAPPGVAGFASYQQLLEEPLDVLFVSLPNYLASDVTVAGLERGLHVFCEKPPGRDVADVLRVRGAEASRPAQKLMYGFNHRYHDSVRDALHLVQSGELGELVNLKGVYGKSKMVRFDFDTDWRIERKLAGGGILLDQGIHLVDMMRLFAGEFVDVHSYVSNRFWNHDVEDNAYALMRTADDVIAMLHSSATQWRHRFNLDLTLSRGAIVLTGILSSTKSYGAETITVIYKGENDAGDPREQTTRYNRDNSWRDEVFAFADTILTDTPVTSGSSLEALRTMELVYRIYQSDRDWAEQWHLDTQPAEVREQG